MRTTSFLISIILLTASCLSRKVSQHPTDLSSLSAHNEAIATFQRLHQSQQQDSSAVALHFRTDAPFYYHPDSGLRALQGDLWLAKQSIHRFHTAEDSSGHRSSRTDYSQQHQEKMSLSERRPSHQKIGWWVIGVLLVIGGGYLIRKFRLFR